VNQKRAKQVIKEELKNLKYSVSRIGFSLLNRDSENIPDDKDILEAVRTLESGINKLEAYINFDKKVLMGCVIYAYDIYNKPEHLNQVPNIINNLISDKDDARGGI